VPRDSRPPRRPRRRWRALRWGLGLAVLAAGAFLAGFVAEVWSTWPDFAALSVAPPASTAFMQAWEQEHRAAPRWRWVPYESISEELKISVVVAEDMGFFDHGGFDWFEVRTALREAWEERRAPRGASTISQQVVKNLWLAPTRSPLRKAKEAVLTVALERHLTKRRILELYLNIAEFGPGIFGAEAAARAYFAEPASALTAHQAAELAAGLPRSSWHPGAASRVYRARVARIEARAAASGWLRHRLR
jgi:monofunctional glycosyltransferase